MKRAFVLFGLPGSGKTTLGSSLSALLNSPHINADVVRGSLSKDLGFSEEARMESARRLGVLAALSLCYGPSRTTVVDFVNPTRGTHLSFLEGMRSVSSEAAEVCPRFVWLNTIPASHCRFQDTAALFDADRLRDPTFQPHLVIDGRAPTVADRLNLIGKTFF